jgi:hypothetical protein
MGPDDLEGKGRHQQWASVSVFCASVETNRKIALSESS